MYIVNNAEAIDRVRSAQFQGRSATEIKPLYIEQNAFNVALDRPIYRVFQLHYLGDISGEC